MTTLRLRVRGPADKYTIWRRARDLQRWPRWMPLVHDLAVDGPLRPGLEGEIRTWFGLRGHLAVVDVDDASQSLTYRIRAGPVRLRVELESREGLAVVHFTAALPVALGSAAFARRGLRRIVAR